MEEALSEQLAYYRARAPEYDDWFFRRGRYDRGEQATKQWFTEVALLETALERAAPFGQSVELAAGTGLWTRRLLPHATSLHVVDGSPEMLGLCRDRLASEFPALGLPTFEQADLFRWRSGRPYDFIFFSFWLSHVPAERFEAFWENVRQSLQPGGRVFFIDSLPNPSSTAHNHQLPAREVPTLVRTLEDGRSFRIYKIFHEPERLQSRLASLGFVCEIEETGEYFYHAIVEANS